MKKMYAIRDYSPSCGNNQSMLIWKGLISDPDFSSDIQTVAATMHNGTSRWCTNCTCDLAPKITVLSLGDELRVTPFRWPKAPNETDALFVSWAQKKVGSSAVIGCRSWHECHYLASFPNRSQLAGETGGVAARWYYSQTFMHDSGIAQFKEVTEALHASLPNVKVGMNQSPITPPTISTYTGNPVHSMIRCFREGCLTLPWSEDWIWQSALGSQQMFTLTVDVMRAGMTRYPKSAHPHYDFDPMQPTQRKVFLPPASGPAMMLYV